MKHLMFDYPTAPSQVFRVVPLDKEGVAHRVEEVYANDGTEFSASSVAVSWRELGVHHLLIGGIVKPAILHCVIDTTH